MNGYLAIPTPISGFAGALALAFAQVSLQCTRCLGGAGLGPAGIGSPGMVFGAPRGSRGVTPPDLSRLSWETLWSPPEEGLEPSLPAFLSKWSRRSPPTGALLWREAEVVGGLYPGFSLMSREGKQTSSTT